MAKRKENLQELRKTLKELQEKWLSQKQLQKGPFPELDKAIADFADEKELSLRTVREYIQLLILRGFIKEDLFAHSKAIKFRRSRA